MMKRLKNGWGENLLIALLVLLTASYLIRVNYQLPFLTMDELAYIGKMQGGIETRLLYGRPSHVIGTGINEVIGFYTPDILGLTKRLITMLALFASVAVALIHFKITPLRAIAVAAFAVVSHQIDWQHNGFVAFFGGYNLFLSFFLLALVLSERSRGRRGVYVLSLFCLFLSFTSEVFVGLAVIYATVRAIQARSVDNLYKSPVGFAAGLYIVLFILLRAIYEGDPTQNGGVSSATYAMGSLAAFSPVEILAGSLKSLIFSVPYFSELRLSNFTTISIASIAAVSLLVLSLRVFLESLKPGKGPSDIVNNGGSAAFLVTLCALAIAPPVLMALQPMKLEWILSGASCRYAFSLYGWVALVMIVSICISRSRAAQSTPIAILVTVAAASFLNYTVPRNIAFADTYSESLAKWRNIDSTIRESKSSPVKLPIELLKHPYIIPFDTSKMRHNLGDILKLIAINVYGKKVIYCYDSNSYDLQVGGAVGAIDPKGFAEQEGDARWTNAAVSEIQFQRKFEKDDVIEISLVNAFASNAELPVEYTIGNSSTKSVFQQSKQVRIPIKQTLDNPKLMIHIPKPVSPLELGVSADPRNLGVMISRIRIGRKQNGQVTFTPAEQCI